MAKDPSAGLNDKQKLFCEEYLKDFNATAAYIRAGYSPAGARHHASRLVTKGNVQAYLQYLRDRVQERSIVTLERTMEEIGRLAFSNVTHSLSFDDGGVTFKDSNSLPSSVTAAIESVTYIHNESESGVNTRKSLKLHNKVQALALLADFFGIREDFNKARATLKRYGLALIPDSGNSDVGWKVEKYVPSSDPDSA